MSDFEDRITLTKTPREMAEQITSRWIPEHKQGTKPMIIGVAGDVIDAIESALLAERERCAEIADDHQIVWNTSDRDYRWIEAARQIADAIRSH